MTIEVQKKESESSASLLKRFSKKVKQSSVLSKARSLRYSARPLSTLKKKEAALSRQARQKKFEQLKKLGKI